MSAPAADTRIADLRRILAAKFPAEETKPGGVFPTGLPGLDAAEGGLRRAALTEFSGSSGAGALFLQAILRAAARERQLLTIVDAARTFEPAACPAPVLARLLLVFCADALQAVKAADLLLRDGNLALILLDLQSAPLRELRRIPASTWHRLQRLAEQTAAAIVVLTPQPMIASAQVRLTGPSRWTLAAQSRWQHELIAEASWQVFPRRGAAARSPLQHATG